MGTDLKSIDLLALMHGCSEGQGASAVREEIFLLECPCGEPQPVKEINRAFCGAALRSSAADEQVRRAGDQDPMRPARLAVGKNEVLARLMDAGKLLFGRRRRELSAAG
jgi:hypothetical protein